MAAVDHVVDGPCGSARDPRLLVAAFRKRRDMRPADPRGVDVFLHLHLALALGLGSAAATELLRSAFAAARAVRECDVSGFMSSWIPLKPPFGPRVRAATALALSAQQGPPPAAEPPSSRREYGGNMFTTARMLELASRRSADEERAAVKRAGAAIHAWEEACAAHGAAAETSEVPAPPAGAAPLPSKQAPKGSRGGAALSLGTALSSPPFFLARALCAPAAEDAVWRVDEALSAGECDRVLAALRVVLAVRGWDLDQYGEQCPTAAEPHWREVDARRIPERSTSTDLPLSAVPDVEPLVREALFLRVVVGTLPPRPPPPRRALPAASRAAGAPRAHRPLLPTLLGSRGRAERPQAAQGRLSLLLQHSAQ